MSIASPAFFWSLFAWNIFFQPFTFILYVSPVLRWVSCRQHISGSCFCIHSASLCLLVGAFNPFMFKVIMAPHSSTLAWRIPWMEEFDGLQSMRSLGVRHDWKTSLSLFTFMHWKRKWQPIPVFLPGESQEWGSLVGCRLTGRTESDTTEATSQQQQQIPFIEKF